MKQVAVVALKGGCYKLSGRVRTHEYLQIFLVDKVRHQKRYDLLTDCGVRVELGLVNQHDAACGKRIFDQQKGQYQSFLATAHAINVEYLAGLFISNMNP